jgi:glutamate racemase
MATARSKPFTSIPGNVCNGCLNKVARWLYWPATPHRPKRCVPYNSRTMQTACNDQSKRVLGVIRPTAEVIGNYTQTKQIGVLGTKGTVQSGSYLLEIEHFFPELKVYQQACPLWVPLIENRRIQQTRCRLLCEIVPGSVDWQQSPDIDTILLACTHYPLLQDKIKAHLPSNINVVAQGDIVASSLVDYLRRHPEMEQVLSKKGNRDFYTTIDDTPDFDHHATLFFGKEVKSEFVDVREGC